MKKKLCAFMICLLLFSANCLFIAHAEMETDAAIILPAALQTIDEDAFYGASAIKKVVVPGGAKSIGARAFAQSTLEEIEIPSSVVSIAGDAFEGCENLVATVEADSYAFYWCIDHKIPMAGIEVGEPSEVSLGISGVNLRVGETIQLTAAVRSEAQYFDKRIKYESSDADVASVDENGLVTANAFGYAVVTVTASNGLEDTCVISVADEETVQSRSFGWETATIVAGDCAELEVILNKEDLDRGYTITSSDSEKLAVDTENMTITALEPGDVTLTLEINPAEEGGDAEILTSSIRVIAGTEIQLTPDKLVLRALGTAAVEETSGALTIEGIPEDLIGVFELYCEDDSLVIFFTDTFEVQALDTLGETRIVCKTFNQELYCTVSVVAEPTYRALIIGEFNNSGASNDLPFASNNLNSFHKIISSADVDGAGKGYEKIVKMFSNPSKTQIKDGIASTFADANEGDVSVIYIVSHGYDVAANGGYHFGMSNYNKSNPDTYIGHAELMSWMQKIPGKVVLILDSCKSGGFIRDQKSNLSANGDIAVLTAQVAEKNASFFNGKSSATKVEFLTYVFCQGCGYEYDTSTTLGYLPADDNSDSFVSVYESFDYCVDEVPGLVKQKADQYFVAGSTSGFIVPGVKTKAQLNDWGGQNPQTHIPSSMNDLIIFGR